MQNLRCLCSAYLLCTVHKTDENTQYANQTKLYHVTGISFLINPLNTKLPFGYIILHTASAERVGQGEVGEVTRRVTCASGLSCQSAMVGTVWANSCPGCMDRL